MEAKKKLRMDEEVYECRKFFYSSSHLKPLPSNQPSIPPTNQPTNPFQLYTQTKEKGITLVRLKGH